MSLFSAEKETLSLRRSDACLGWHCLTSATRFGVIFSIVVTFIILSIVWMYCMGRARIFRIKTKTNHASGKQRGWRYHGTPKGTAPPGLYSMPQNLVFGNGLPQNFPVYFLPGPQVLPTQPFGVINSPTARIHTLASANLPQGTQYPAHSHITAPEPPKTKDSHKEPGRAPDGCSSGHPTWWQRFYRAFNLPAGAASTIASSPSPSPEPEQRAIIRIDHSATNRRPENIPSQFNNQKDKRTFKSAANEQDDTSSMLCNLNASNDSRESIRSDAATVHSDDFEMNSQRR
ncbi:hypothetical protein M441DRAFT_134632 [Trichoderma asperellum CBS 433.97]|uniref:Uncharacterized protein n=1 Tax=Trichoderma asperellum (strain ATCC 204424 / CBS 433.97 / NBRC 101777) TaxID=1042311 RepID=A0A2T3ZEM1_TRIA4|nr:hypothetical protein M441DRAFT_134632 [Trichoderma asperellum CBS 433.97]PTB43239.1 hypothetical protein M441DRAFT_134632 [Trichoderma asperellum CBS 433.97]WVH32636.1 transmembrane receptor protein [Trichoderma asperellum]